MIAYNARPYIGAAIEGVLSQQVDFTIELVIGDDASTDGTRQICEQYAAQHPDIIRVLPPEPNQGIAANTLRTMGACDGTYIAVCDGDDVWFDPEKLRKQVGFLNANPQYGVVYTDVETISENGSVIGDAEHEMIRKLYASGDVFFNLLEANFINNSTALFRRSLLKGHIVYPDRSYQIPDHIRWLYIAAQSKVHFMPVKSTGYRKHTMSLSVDVPRGMQIGNRTILYKSLHRIIPLFDTVNMQPLTPAEKILFFRRICSLIIRGPGSLRQRWRLSRLLPKYFPGYPGIWHLGRYKYRKLAQSMR